MNQGDDYTVRYFTKEQACKMREILNGTRSSILSSNGCQTPNVCDPVLDIWVTNQNLNSISLEWTDVLAQQYLVRYRPSGTTKWKTKAVWMENFTTLDNLMPVEYEIQVKPNCNENFTSIFASTLCASIGACTPDCEMSDLVVNQNMVLPMTEVNGQLKIIGNTTLTINSEVKFTEGSGVTIYPGSTLIIDGGTLTSCGNGLWKGIEIAGYQGSIFQQANDQLPGGNLLIRNGAVIENADIGVNKVNKYFSNDINGLQIAAPADIGTLNILSDATIKNCRTGVFISSTGQSQASIVPSVRIDHANFIDCNLGLDIFGNLEIPINNSTFDNNLFGIECTNSTIAATQNTFVGGSKGILINALYPIIQASSIVDNGFFGCGHAIYTESLANMLSIDVRENSFVESPVTQMGISSITAQNNDFIQCRAGYTSAATSLMSDNLVANNQFISSKTANRAYDVNTVQYISNCYEGSSVADIALASGASILSSQGTEQSEAGNCFEDQKGIYTAAGSTAFDYWLYPPNESSCKNPSTSFGTSNYSIEDALEPLDQECGDPNPNMQQIAIYLLAQCIKDKEALSLKELEELLTDIQEVLADDESSAYESARRPEKEEPNKYDEETLRCLYQAIQLFLNSCRQEQCTSILAELIESLGFDALYPMVYGLYQQQGDLDNASRVLNLMQYQDEASKEFVSGQQALILAQRDDRKGIENQGAYANDLLESAHKLNALSGFNRSIYHELVNERIFINLPEILIPLESRNEQEGGRDDALIIQNPIALGEAISIKLPKSFLKNMSHELIIYDMRGNTIYQHIRTDDQYDIENHMHSGIYILSLRQGDTVITRKICII